MSSLLEKINVPADVKSLAVGDLEELASEIRGYLISRISRTGGHLAANLGVIELTIALLKVFSPPEDKLVWDTSHQAYAYKMLTGRKERLSTIRQFGGLSGFLKMDESEYDAFGAGHAGTALSAALGIAVARDRNGGNEHVVAVIGDGAAGCGVSFEALNNIATATNRLIVILNDNQMSIDANVGAMSRYLGSLLANPSYNRLKSKVEDIGLKMRMGRLRSSYHRLEEAVKSLFVKNVVFEEFGLRYVGPVDGHNIPVLVDALKTASESTKPILLHIATQKGRGYEFAEDKPEKWHGTVAFDVETGEALDPPGYPGYSKIFGNVLQKMAESDKRIIAITAAMKSGTGLDGFARQFPDRFFDVGISEEHALTFAAGLAARGLRPVVVLYSSFFQRAYDYFVHDICLQNLPVLVCLDRAGVVGEDGPTHHGIFDIPILRSVPGFVFMQPSNEPELANMINTSMNMKMPAVIRYPRGGGMGNKIPEKLEIITTGTAEVITEGDKIQIWALGERVLMARDVLSILAKKGIQAGLVNARFIKPLDLELLKNQMNNANVFVTIENGARSGGFGEGVAAELVNHGYKGRILNIGWPDEFIPHGSIRTLEEKYGQTPDVISSQIFNLIGIK